MLSDAISIVRSYLPILKGDKKLKKRIDEEENRTEGMHNEFWIISAKIREEEKVLCTKWI
jgi:hypothetical protein